MRRVLRYIWRAAVGLAMALLLLVAAVVLGSATAGFHEAVRGRLEAALTAALRAEVTVARIEGSLWGGWTVHHLVMRDRGLDVVRVPWARIACSPLPLLRGQVGFCRMEVADAALRFERDEQGRWIPAPLEALWPRPAPEAQEPGGWARTAASFLGALKIRGARIDARFGDGDGRVYVVRDLELGARIVSGAADAPEVEVVLVSSRVAGGGLPEVSATGSATYRGGQRRPALRVSDLSLRSERSLVHARGEVVDLRSREVSVAVRAEKLDPLDLARLLPGLPLRIAVEGSVQVSGRPERLDVDARVAAGAGRAVGRAALEIREGAPFGYQVTLAAAALDPHELFGWRGAAGVVDGTAQASGSGLVLETIEGQGQVRIRSLTVAGLGVGSASVSARLQRGTASLTADLHGAAGPARVKMRVALTDPARPYQVSVAVEGVDPGKVFAGGRLPPAALTLDRTLTGVGYALENMTAEGEIHMRPSTVGPVKIEAGRLVASIDAGRIRVTEGTLAAEGASLSLSADIGLRPEDEGRLSYTLSVDDLSPWFALVGVRGGGRLALAGEAEGSVKRLHLRGRAKAAGLRLDGSGAESASLVFSLAGVGGPTPVGTVEASAAGVSLGVRLQRVNASLKALAREPGVAALEVEATDAAGRLQRLSGEVSYAAPVRSLRVSELRLELPSGMWQARGGALIVQEPGGVRVERVELVSGEQRLVLEGGLSATGAENLLIQVDDLALEGLAFLLPGAPPIQGRAFGRVLLGGTASAPTITSEARAERLVVAGQEYAGLDAALRYAGDRATIHLNFRQDASRSLRAEGSLPLHLAWQGGVRASGLGPITGRLYSSGLSLAFLNAFAGPGVKDLGGELGLTVSLSGPVSHPVVSGDFGLRRGRLRIPALGVAVSELTVRGSTGPDQVRFDEVSARAREGSIRGQGALMLRDYVPDTVRLALRAERWPAIRTRRHRAEVEGNVSVTGSVRSPTVRGRLSVLRAVFRPDLALLTAGGTPVTRDDTILVVDPKGMATSPAAEADNGGPGAGLLSALDIDVVLGLRRDVWIRHESAAAELTGELRLVKGPGQAKFAATGAVETVRGWVGFQGRRFTLTRGRLLFGGGELADAELDAVAEHRLPDYLVEASAQGKVRQPTLSLRSEPELGQADILALLLFGKPAGALGTGEKVALQDRAISITSGYAAERIGESITRFLGLDRLGIDPAAFDFGGGRVGFSQYLTRSAYVSASQDITGKGGQEVSAEYDLGRGWQFSTSTGSAGKSGADLFWRKQY